MKHALSIDIQPQPTDSSCGPTCLAAVYKYWDDPLELDELIAELRQLTSGGTLAVQLASHALRRGYRACITTYNLHMFDPSWFAADTGQVDADLLAEKLTQQLAAKGHRLDVDQVRLAAATDYYLEYLKLGGEVQMRPLDETLLESTLQQDIPILCGLSATYLYQESRERAQPPNASGKSSVPDDINGDPQGHFVILHGYDKQAGSVLIADPLHPNPLAPTNKYAAPIARLTSAILLGIVTYDANLLTLVPAGNDH